MIKLYDIVKFPAWLCLKIYCKNITLNKPEKLNNPGPILYIVNHPNSFLDSMIICALSKYNIYSLARGDVFKKPIADFLLKQLLVYPVYREREGHDLVSKNYETFETCLNFFKKNKNVLIFIEGTSEPEWRLRPLKKGAARLALQAWENKIPLKVLPVGVNYSNFKYFGKEIVINFGEYLTEKDFEFGNVNTALKLQYFTQIAQEKLEPLVLNLPTKNHQNFTAFYQQPKIWYYLKPLGWLGFILNYPFFKLVQPYLFKKLYKLGHYESALFGVMVVMYPIYVLVIALICYLLVPLYSVFFLIFLGLPFLAFIYTKSKKLPEC